MKIQYTVIPFFLFACASPNIESANADDIVDAEDKDITEEETPEDTPEELEDPEESTSEEEVEEETPEDVPVEPEESDSNLALVSGIWNVASANLADDVCDWDTQLMMFFGVGSDALLPSDFTVEGREGSFSIEANSYGASGPISCTINNSEFSCETQSVTPIDFDLGSMGWSYAIEFSGVINDSRALDGTAFVSFPTMPEFLVPMFQAIGIDPSQCTQTYELSLVSAE